MAMCLLERFLCTSKMVTMCFSFCLLSGTLWPKAYGASLDLSVPTPISSEIRETNSMGDVIKCLRASPPETLAAFDVDEVLICPEDQVLRNGHVGVVSPMIRHIRNIQGIPEAGESSEVLWSRIFQTARTQLVAPEIAPALSEIQASGAVRVLALTSAWAGAYGLIKSLEDRRFAELARVGIDFSKTFSGIPTLSFPDIHTGRPGVNPLYKKGIIFTCGQDKGAVLLSFLSTVRYRPERVVFVDDVMSNILSVQAMCMLLKIPYLGFHYTGANCLPKSFNPAAARLQCEKLLTEKRWYNDQEVGKLLLDETQKKSLDPSQTSVSKGGEEQAIACTRFTFEDESDSEDEMEDTGTEEVTYVDVRANDVAGLEDLDEADDLTTPESEKTITETLIKELGKDPLAVKAEMDVEAKQAGDQGRVL